MVARWCITVEQTWHSEVVMVVRSIEHGGHSEARVAWLVEHVHTAKETSGTWCCKQGGVGRKG